jgi:hypothetical protein
MSRGLGGQRPIFPMLAVLIWADDGGFYVNNFDSPWFPTIAAALDAVANSTPTKNGRLGRAAAIRKKRRLPPARRSTPKRQVQIDFNTTKRRLKRRNRK